jgi:hypothetical protein
VRNLSNQKRFKLTIEAWRPPHPMWLRQCTGVHLQGKRLYEDSSVVVLVLPAAAWR